jgi:hypothetical protein
MFAEVKEAEDQLAMILSSVNSRFELTLIALKPPHANGGLWRSPPSSPSSSVSFHGFAERAGMIIAD